MTRVGSSSTLLEWMNSSCLLFSANWPLKGSRTLFVESSTAIALTVKSLFERSSCRVLPFWEAISILHPFMTSLAISLFLSSAMKVPWSLIASFCAISKASFGTIRSRSGKSFNLLSSPSRTAPPTKAVLSGRSLREIGHFFGFT